MRLKFIPDEYIKKINFDSLEHYYVSNYGKIFNNKKEQLHGHTNLQGYIFVRLFYNNKNTLFRLHRLICITFNGKTNKDKNIVDHINRIRNDNRSINLRWVSRSDNMNNKSKVNISFEKKNILDSYINLKKSDEEFKIINNSTYGDFPNYSISNYGRVKNNLNNKLLKPTITDEKYLVVRLVNKPINKGINIHRLVCEFFNDKLNTYNDNYYKNLEWVSIAKNNQHSKNISINMLDDNKNIIKTFDSYTLAYKYLNKKNTSCIQKQTPNNKKAHGYYWSINNK